MDEILAEEGYDPYTNINLDNTDSPEEIANNEDTEYLDIIDTTNTEFSVTDDAVEVIASLNDSDSDLPDISIGDNTENAARHNDHFLDLGDIDSYDIVNGIHSQSIKTVFKST